MSPPDRLVAAELSESLGESTVGCRIIVLESTRSTNEFLRRMLAPGLPEGFVVFAEHQSAGRGQRGKRWESAPHLGLWFSVLLRPRIAPAASACLTNWAAQAIMATIRGETGLEAAIKPPNDVFVGDRKMAGVLVETKAGPGPEFEAIIGIGVNMNQMADDFPAELRARAGSLAMALGQQVNRTDFAIALLLELERTREFGVNLSPQLSLAIPGKSAAKFRKV
jgi:BirA family transcriptional regulator, biotin operon repressor / biotin---[acetyl-CoA-carboxylase] ligase